MGFLIEKERPKCRSFCFLIFSSDFFAITARNTVVRKAQFLACFLVSCLRRKDECSDFVSLRAQKNATLNLSGLLFSDFVF